MKKQENQIEQIKIKEGIFPLTQTERKDLNLDGAKTNEQNKSAHFPKTIREQRKERGLTQQKVADCLGVTKSTIGLYETGDNVPDIKNLYKLSKLLGLSADYLIGLSAVKNPDPKVKEIHDFTGLSEEAISLLNDANLKNNVIVTIISQLLTNERFLIAIKLLERLENEKTNYEAYSINFENALGDIRSELAELIFRKPGGDLYIFESGEATKETGKRYVGLPLFIEFIRQITIKVFSDVIYDITGKDDFMNYLDILQGLYIDDHYGGKKYSKVKEE
jgi:transcriptional regulator with XRE-family HTH domain/virulence-associated protein VapD